jgi:hypothetical protein
MSRQPLSAAVTRFGADIPFSWESADAYHRPQTVRRHRPPCCQKKRDSFEPLVDAGKFGQPRLNKGLGSSTRRVGLRSAWCKLSNGLRDASHFSDPCCKFNKFDLAGTYNQSVDRFDGLVGFNRMGYLRTVGLERKRLSEVAAVFRTGV